MRRYTLPPLRNGQAGSRSWEDMQEENFLSKTNLPLTLVNDQEKARIERF